ncbi:MAG: hypothetical protein HYX78_02365 [Armatimonadetes bacterium]|nr:hypothetical protein [Armatimonadota bacterium]
MPSSQPVPEIQNPKPEIQNKKGGPKTAEGKKRSSLNALKHGLTAKSPHAHKLISGETRSKHDAILGLCILKLRPSNAEQMEIVRRIVGFAVRYATAEAMQKRFLRLNPGVSKYSPTMVKLERQKQMQTVHYERARLALARLKKPKRKKRLNRTQKTWLELKKAQSVLRILRAYEARNCQNCPKRTEIASCDRSPFPAGSMAGTEPGHYATDR